MSQKQLLFNISASSLNLYRESQLQFYYTYVQKADPDTDVPVVYGRAGSIVHEVLEKHTEIEDIQAYFDAEWEKQGLYSLPGLNGRPLDKNVFFDAALAGIELLEKEYNITEHEEYIQFPIVDDERAKITLKGFIDAKHVEEDGSIHIVDWKTSSKVKTDDAFYMQGKMYALLTYMKHGILPKKVIFEYLRLADKKEYVFTKEEVLEHYKYVCQTVREILQKGFDISQYEVGEISSIFNQHKLKCMDEQIRRQRMSKMDFETVSVE